MSAGDDRPQVTVSVPGGLPPSDDVLGDAPRRRRGPSWLVPFVVGALLGAVTVPQAVASVRDGQRADRLEQAREESRAATARAEDALDLDVEVLALSSDGTFEPGVLIVRLRMTARGAFPVVVDDVVLSGGLLGTADPAVVGTPVVPGDLPAEQDVRVEVDCGQVQAAVASRGASSQAALVVRATPRSGRQRSLPPVLDAGQLRSALLAACLAGDPEIEPLAFVDVVSRRVLVTVEVDGGAVVDVVGVRSAGLVLGTSVPLPIRIERGSRFTFDVEVPSVDCGVEVGPLLVDVRLADGRAKALQATQGSQPGSTPFARHVRDLTTERCR